MESKLKELLSSTSNYLSIIKCDTTTKSRPFKCAVGKCKNHFTDFESHKSNTFKFHNFPKDDTLNDEWKVLCGLPSQTSTRKLKICSDHFTLEDYERNLKEEFLNPGFKRSLKETAIPSINIDPIDEDPATIIESENVQETEQLTSSEEEPEVVEKNKEIKEISTLTREIKSLRGRINYRQKFIESKRRVLADLKAQTFNRTKVLNIPRSLLSETQIELLRGKKKVFWTDDDLARAFTLRHMGGKDVYLYLKNTLNYPLPALSCVQAWANN